MRHKRFREAEFSPPLCSLEFWGAAVGIGATAGGLIGGAAIGAAGSIAASSIQAGGQEQAANTQAGELASIQQLESPYVQAGYGATSTINQLLGTTGQPGTTVAGTNLPQGYLTQQFNPTQAQLEAYPGYQFQLSQGDLATQAATSAGTGALSGSALKQLSSFNQGLAASNYQNYFNQFQTQQNNIFSRLSGIAQLGQAAAGGVASAGTQLGTGIAQAQAAEAGSIAGGVSGAAGSVGNSATLYALLSGGYLGGNTNLNSLASANGWPGGSANTYCDYYLKWDLEPMRFNQESGLMAYSFIYKDDEEKKRHVGYIAQEVMEKYPHVVSRGPKGYLMVDYSRLPGWEELDKISRELDA